MKHINARIAAPVLALVAVMALGTVAWLTYTAGAEEKHCTDLDPVTSYDVSWSNGPFLMTVKVRENQYHILMTAEGSSFFAESIFDGQGTEYSRDEVDPEWVASPNDNEFGDLDSFPFLPGSLCPDIEGATHVGEEQIASGAASHYTATSDGASGASGDQSKDWDFWINKAGWLVEAEREYSDGPSERATISSTGGTDPIAIPSTGQ